MNEHKKKFERRKDQLGKNRRHPVELLQIHGVKAKIHLNSNLTSVAENCLIPWTGDTEEEITIDRFDARAHLDRIPDQLSSGQSSNESIESKLNYQRFKDLIQCEFLDISEETRLKQEIFIPKISTNSSDDSDSDDDGGNPMYSNLSKDRISHLNGIAQRYLVEKDDFIKFLKEEQDERQRIRLARKAENEKSMLPSKSKKERNLPKERKIHITPEPSDVRDIPSSSIALNRHSRSSSSSSNSSDNRNFHRKKEFIQSIGGSSDEEDNKRDRRHRSKERKHRSRTPSPSPSPSRSRIRDRHHQRSRRRSTSRTQSGHRRSRDRSRDRDYRHHRDDWRGDRERNRRRERERDRDREKEREKEKERECRVKYSKRDKNEDEFGRTKRKRTPSPIREKLEPPKKPVDPPESVAVPPPPTIKRYYRPELEKDSDASSTSSDAGDIVK